MSELKVPFAVDSNDRLHSPDEAKKGMNYFCPNCHDPLVFRNGEIKIPHFAHKTSLTCSNESITHKVAKGLIRQAVIDWKHSNCACPKAIRVCLGCNKKMTQRLPHKIDDAILEYRLPEGFIVDIALMSKGVAIAAIEIKVTHEVDFYKHTNLSLPYLELDGYQVINNPLEWIVINEKISHRFCTMDCMSKYNDKESFIKREKEMARQLGVSFGEYVRYKKNTTPPERDFVLSVNLKPIEYIALRGIMSEYLHNRNRDRDDIESAIYEATENRIITNRVAISTLRECIGWIDGSSGQSEIDKMLKVKDFCNYWHEKEQSTPSINLFDL